MSMNEVVASTPCYVLMDGNHRIGPKVVQLQSGIECTTIYGFSGKHPYDKFCMNSQLALTPYPLVRGYLQNQTGEAGDKVKLVVLDATGPCESYLQATSMEAVLEAQVSRTAHVTVEYRLIFDQDANDYRVEEASL